MTSLSEGARPEVVVEVIDLEDDLVVKLREELDSTNASQLEEALFSCLVGEDPVTFVFDMAELGFIDSSGLAVALRGGAGALLVGP